MPSSCSLLPAPSLAAAPSHCRQPCVAQGEVLFREGDVCSKVFFIVEGDVELSKRLPPSLRKPPGTAIVVEHVHTQAAIGISEAVMKDAFYRVRASVGVRCQRDP